MSFSVRLLSGLLLSCLLTTSQYASAATQTVFGPKNYSPGILKPGDYQEQFAATAATGTLKIINGDGRDIQLQTCSGNIVQKLLCQVNNVIVSAELAITRPTSFSVEINGSVVATQANLPAQKGSLLINVALKKSQNSLRVKVAGSYLSKIKIEVEQAAGSTNQLPIASFQLSLTQGFAPLAVSVNAMGSSDPDGQIVDYLWDFGDGTFGSGALATHVFLESGKYPIKLTVRDNQGAISVQSQQVTVLKNQQPIADLRLVSAQEGIVPLMVMFDAGRSHDPENGPLKYYWSFDGITSIEGKAVETYEYKESGNFKVTLTVRDENGGVSTASVQVQVNEPKIPHPPVETAPSLENIEGPTFEQKIGFLYQGVDPIQRNVIVEKIDPKRVSLITGIVRDESGLPLSGAIVKVLNEVEFGETVTREDGGYDLAVNAGAEVTIDISKNGYTKSQRKIEMLEQDYFTVTDVRLTKLTSKVTEVLMGAPVSQIVEGAKSSDDSGERIPAIFFSEGTTANIVMPDGSKRKMSELNLRMTEVTVGADGLQKMPALLPSNSAYTYAVEISADEAVALGAEKIELSKPVSYYLDNFLNIPVGSAVPSGEYDYSRGVWSAEKDGLVVKIVSKQNGVVQLDLGSGRAATNIELEALGFTNSELSDLARKYDIGKSLWRIQLAHFSTYDFNYSVSVDEKATVLNSLKVSVAPVDTVAKLNGACLTGCIIEPEARNMKEIVGIQDTPISLVYSAARTDGRSAGNMVRMKIADDTTPESVLRISVVVSIAGKVYSYTYSRDNKSEVEFVWDGLDSYGRALDVAKAKIYVGYVFPESFAIVPYSETIRSFGAVPYRGNAMLGRGEDTVWSNFEIELKAANRGDVKLAKQSANGWSVSNVHRYDPKLNAIYFGDGRNLYLSSLPKVYQTIAGQGIEGFSGDDGLARFAKLRSPSGIAKGADGSLYIADSGNNRIRKIDSKGIITTVVGSGIQGNDGDGGPALDASLNRPHSIQVDRNGVIYISDSGNHCIRKVDDHNIISTIVGRCGESGDSDRVDGDGFDITSDTPAFDVRLNNPKDVVLASDGSLYISDTGNGKIRKLTTAGYVQRIAGISNGEAARPGLAIKAFLDEPRVTGVDRNGALLVVESRANKINRIVGSKIETVIGTGLPDSNGLFLGPLETNIGNPQFAVSDGEGKIFYSDNSNKRISYLDLNDYINPMIGYVTDNYKESDYATGTTAVLGNVQGIILDQDGKKIVVDSGLHKVATFGFVTPDLVNGLYVIPSEDTSEVFVFDSSGKHLRTLFGRTGRTKYAFEYDSEGNLLTIVDAFQKRTAFMRSGKILQQIVGNHGQTTVVGADSNGYLSQIIQPGGESTEINYTERGLMTSYRKPNGSTSKYEYDAGGLLSKEMNAIGGIQMLGSYPGSVIEYRTGLGKKTRFFQQYDEDGYERIVTEEDNSPDQDTIYSGWRWRLNRDETTIDERYQYDSRSRGISRFIGYRYEWMGASDSEQTIQRSYQFRNGDYFNYIMEEKLAYGGAVGSTIRRYDSANLTETITTPEGRVSTIKFDEWERPVFIQKGDMSPMTLEYDSEGNLVTAKVGQRKVQYVYDGYGRVSQMIDALGGIASFTYDSNNRLLSKSTSNETVIYYSYDQNSNITAVKPPDRGWHQMLYNGLDMFASYVPPVNEGTQNWQKKLYSGDRELLSEQFADGSQISYYYNNSRLNMMQTSATKYRLFSYVPSTGKLSSIYGGDTSYLTYKYGGSLITRSGDYEDKLVYSYLGSPVRISTEWVGSSLIGSLMWRNYDGDNYPTNIGDLFLSRDQNGLLSSSNLKNVLEQFEYTAYGEISKRKSLVKGAQLHTEEYRRDLLGRIIQKTITNGQGTTDFNYSYDLNGRLKDVSTNNQVIRSYSYDRQGNRLESGYKYDGEDRLIEAKGNVYSYNSKGELIKKINVQTGAETLYSYDMLGVLVGVVLPSGEKITYVGDGLGRRSMRIGSLGAIDFTYDLEGRVVGSRSGSDHYIYGEHIHSPDGMFRNMTYYKFVKDHLGSILYVVNAETGAVVQSLEYDEFGIVLKDTNPGFQPFGFAGGLYDPETKLVRFGAREYDSEIGRWTSKDPILFRGGDTNLYGYTFSDPVNFIDPSGLKFEFRDAASRRVFNALLNSASLSSSNRAMIDKLELSSSIISIGQGAVRARPFGVSGLTEGFIGNRNSDITIWSAGTSNMDLSILLHELVHANQIDNGTDVLEGPAYREGGDFLGRCKNGDN